MEVRDEIDVPREMNMRHNDVVDLLRVCTPWSRVWGAGEAVGHLG